MAIAQATGPLELASEQLYALGGVVAVDGRISWFDESARGYAPLLCYLATEPDGDLLLDTSLPIFEHEIVAQLGSLHPADKPLKLALTRNPEFDSIGNAGLLLTRFRTQQLISVFNAEPWLYFRSRSGAVPPAERPVDMRPDWTEIKRGLEFPIGSGGRSLLITIAPLRLLSTVWAYDAATRTLFTSDAFGHNLMQREDDPWIVDAGNDTVSYEQVRDHLLAKFDWLAAAHTEVIREQLSEVFATHDVETIAPQFGRLIRGRDVVARHRDLVLAALEEVGV
jgi:flavorubredoxin